MQIEFLWVCFTGEDFQANVINKLIPQPWLISKEKYISPLSKDIITG